MITRRTTRQIQLGNVTVGGGAPITVQSMTKTDTRDVQATLLEIWSLEAAGCDIVRCAVPVREAAEKLGEIKRQIRIPLVADIHFNYKLALIALEQGVDGLRLNPGNIGGKQFVQQVVNVAKEKKIPIRIGVNAGSLEKDLLARYGGPTPDGMVESALRHIRILEDCNYPEMKVSLKASDPLMMIEAYRMLADQVDYPLHLGVTEAGTPGVGTIKSAVGLGALLSEGIGDTVRVSLSADPTEEVRVGIDILKSLGLRTGGLTFVSCPSCGRADVDLVKLAKEVEDEFRGLNEEIHIAVMGCLPEGGQVITRDGPKPIEAIGEADEVLTLAGYYLAEGTLSGAGGKPYQQFFYFHEDQVTYVDRLRGILRGLGLKTSVQRRRHTAEVIAHSLALGRLLLTLFRHGAERKCLPAWMERLPHEKQRALVRALWEGDGYVGRVRGYWRATYSTSSFAL